MNQEELDYNIRICAFDLGVDKKYVRPIPKNELVIDFFRQTFLKNIK